MSAAAPILLGMCSTLPEVSVKRHKTCGALKCRVAGSEEQVREESSWNLQNAESGHMYEEAALRTDREVPSAFCLAVSDAQKSSNVCVGRR